MLFQIQSQEHSSWLEKSSEYMVVHVTRKMDITVTTESVVINIEEKSIFTVVEDLALSITEGIKVNVLAEI